MIPLQRISLAQDFFRFAYLVGSPVSYGLEVKIPSPPDIQVWGKHSLTPKDLHLSAERFGICGTLLERLAYRLLAMELDSALGANLSREDRLNHTDDFVRNASIVVRVMRNAVAHNILNPVWKIDRKFQNRKFVIDDVLVFDTSELKNGDQLRRSDFGGPIALFRLSERIVSYLYK